MVFSAPVFLFCFLPVCLLLYWLSPRCMRNATLLVASLTFYAWGELEYTLVMLVSIVCNYVLGKQLRRASQPGWVLAAGVVINLSMLGYFKYAAFFSQELNKLFAWAEIPLSLELGSTHLPIGISFFTFQALSYLVDVYRGKVDPQDKLQNVALYIVLFPQLIAGPIVRYAAIADQLHTRSISLSKFVGGAQRFILGLAKKMLIADQMAVVADSVFGANPDHLLPSLAWFGVLGYTLQIYFDFSGYSDMAIGLGRMFGFHFEENFRWPYIAQSIQDFWRRWHISLSSWFRDYVYIPLGGSRGSALRTYRNLLIVFLVTGIWHGASWSFVVWGLFHGSFLMAERIGLGQVLDRTPRPLRHGYTLAVVMVGWILFRAVDLEHAAVMFTRLWVAGPASDSFMTFDMIQRLLTRYRFAMAALGILLSAPVSIALKARWDKAVGEVSAWKWAHLAGYAALLLLVCQSLATQDYSPFIYFRF